MTASAVCQRQRVTPARRRPVEAQPLADSGILGGAISRLPGSCHHLGTILPSELVKLRGRPGFRATVRPRGGRNGNASGVVAEITPGRRPATGGRNGAHVDRHRGQARAAPIVPPASPVPHFPVALVYACRRPKASPHPVDVPEEGPDRPGPRWGGRPPTSRLPTGTNRDGTENAPPALAVSRPPPLDDEQAHGRRRRGGGGRHRRRLRLSDPGRSGASLPHQRGLRRREPGPGREWLKNPEQPGCRGTADQHRSLRLRWRRTRRGLPLRLDHGHLHPAARDRPSAGRRDLDSPRLVRADVQRGRQEGRRGQDQPGLQRRCTRRRRRGPGRPGGRWGRDGGRRPLSPSRHPHRLLRGARLHRLQAGRGRRGRHRHRRPGQLLRPPVPLVRC